MSFRPYMLLLIFLCFALAPAHAVAAGGVEGSILYGAGQYRAEVAGKEVQKVSSQYGKVSLDYLAQGVLNDARVGNYTLMLGYEFNVLDPSFTVNGVKDPAAQHIETGKILYQGEFLLAPGGLPFRLNAYARDIQRSSFLSGTMSPSLPVGLQGAGRNQSQASLLSPDIVTDIKDGTQHEVGATLLLGIRNGSYLGAYRNVLSQLPRLLVDYRQTDVRDLARDSSQQHYRDRDLAFISLNKKDNWVHFRTHDYTDFLDATQNFKTKQVMIGTVDHLLTRQWINFTNWLRVSGDLSYTVEKRKDEEFDENTYKFNLFASAQRREFNSTVLSSFERTTEGERLTQDLNLPIYFNYEPNRDSYYRGSLRSEFTRQSALMGLTPVSDALQRDRRDVTFDLGSEFFRTRAVVFKPRIMIGVTEDGSSQGMNEKLTLELVNTRGRNFLPWTAGYTLASTQTSTDTNTSVYLEQSLYGNVEKSLGRAMRVGLIATVRYGQGQLGDSVNNGVTDRVLIGETGVGLNSAESERFLLYDGRIFWEHVGELFANRFEVTAEGIETDSDSLTTTELRHELKTTGRISKFSLSSSLVSGRVTSIQSVTQGYLNVPSNLEGANFGWSSKAEYSYEPDRRLHFTLLGNVRSLSGDEKEHTAWLGSEKLEYLFYKSNGLVRKIASLTEEFGAEGSSIATGRDEAFFLRLAAAIYPTRVLYAKIISDFVMFGPGDSEQMTLNAETGANYEKLQVALSYGRGYKNAEGLLAEVKEERWDVKVRKTF